MNYPFWEIPYLGSGWVIGIIAIFHVMISQFAVGGGLYLPMAERKAMRMADPELRDCLAEATGQPLQVLPHPHRRLRHRLRRRHLVCHRTHPPRGHQHADSQLRLRLGHGVGLLPGRTDHDRRLLLHLEPDRRQTSSPGGLGLCRRLGSHAHHHQRHSFFHAHAGRHLARRCRNRP